MATLSMRKVNNFWRCKNAPTKLKTRLVSVLIWPIGIYGCKAWTLNKFEENIMNTFEMWVHRRMLNFLQGTIRQQMVVINK